MFRAYILVAFTLTVILSAIPLAYAESRIALVIGNDDYIALPDLNNARADAESIAAKLRHLGFQVILKLNATERDMGRALVDFESQLAKADVGLVFYAGHGIQAGGNNYLIPADAQIEIEQDLRYEGVNSADFLEAMQRAGSPLNILILDACRDNPLPQRTRSAKRGLTVVSVPAGLHGTAIIYSAAPGQVAEDGPKGGNGIFTGELLRTLDRPGLKLEEVFKLTAKQVADRTGGKQDPWFHSSIKGDFYFRPDNSSTMATAPAHTTPPAPESQNAEVLFWQSIMNNDNPAMFRAYLNQYPTGSFVDIARIKIEALEKKDTATAEPIIIQARNYQRGTNVEIGVLPYGSDIVHNASPYTPQENVVEYDFMVGLAGSYDLLIEYAAGSSRAVVITLNGEIVNSYGFLIEMNITTVFLKLRLGSHHRRMGKLLPKVDVAGAGSP